MVGVCGLCLQTKETQNSHFLPAALFKRLRGPTDDDPVYWTERRAITSSKQVSSPFLCADCELRFSVNGENYVVTQCIQQDGRFKLRELLLAVLPLGTVELETNLYDANVLLDCNVDQYVYFASSIFWRASAHSWKMGKQEIGKVCLGQGYQEQFRLYLMGEAAFPQNARVFIRVCTETYDDLMNLVPPFDIPIR